MEQSALGIAAVIGGIIASWSLRSVFWFSLIPQIICVFLSFQLTEPKVHSKESGNIYLHLKEALKGFATNKKLRLLTLASSTTYALTESSFQFRSAFSIALASMGSRIRAGDFKHLCNYQFSF